ncbi:MAG: hypothetical protein A2X94_16895 [Bdellovibrionales bacterium GWB1_55_8]|nr:MAG: hypothetical protein A2X94_16895 [Bdellovibrionales bacterium GWB1_55_8]
MAETIKEFVEELSGFAETAEKTLAKIESDLLGERALFKVFSERMLAIRGTALQLELPEIAKIAGLGEEIAVKAETAETRAQLRKCVGALWDALTTVKYLLQNHEEQTSEEREILIRRLEATLEAMGGARPVISMEELSELLGRRN